MKPPSTAAMVTNIAVGCLGLFALYVLFDAFDPLEVPRKDVLFVLVLYICAAIPTWGWARVSGRHGFDSISAWAWLIVSLLTGLFVVLLVALLNVVPAH